jgi:hypothetical protein
MIRDVNPQSGSRRRILIFFLPIPDPEVKKAPDPGSGSATLHQSEGNVFNFLT